MNNTNSKQKRSRDPIEFPCRFPIDFRFSPHILTTLL